MVLKYLAGKTKELRIGGFPGVTWQSGFAASFLKKLLAGKMMLDSYLRQQQSMTMRGGDEQAVPANFQLIGLERSQFGQYRNLDL